MRYVLVLTLLFLLWSCSEDPVAGGNGSETTNGLIAVVNGLNEPVAGAEVSLYEISHNPLTDDSTDGYYRGVTDEQGLVRLNLREKQHYNIFAQDSSGRMGFVHRRFLEDADSLFSVVELCNPGALELLVPQEGISRSGNLFLEGTGFTKSLDSAEGVAGSYFKVDFPAMPETTLPPVRYYLDSVKPVEVVVADSIEIVADSQVAVATTVDFEEKPIWRFGLCVSVKNALLDTYVTKDSIEGLIHTSLQDALAKMNSYSGFDGIFYFEVDSFHYYDGDASTEAVVDHNSDYKIIYSDVAPGSGRIHYDVSNYMIWNNSTPANLFNDVSTNMLVFILSRYRGAVDLRYEIVYSDSNLVSNEAYYVDDNALFYPYSSEDWNEYIVHLLNANTDITESESAIAYEALPNQLQFQVTDLFGEPRVETEISLFPVDWSTGKVQAVPLDIFFTDTDGFATFVGDVPYKNPNEMSFQYSNLLIRVVSGSDTLYNWMPLHEVGQAWFEGQKDTYTKSISF